jgi:hypothetical protein
MLLMRLAVRLQLLESGRRDRHDPEFLVFVPRGKKTAYNLRTRFLRHLSNATLTPGGPRLRGSYIEGFSKKRRGTPESKKDRAKLLRIVLVLDSQMPLRRRRLKKF